MSERRDRLIDRTPEGILRLDESVAGRIARKTPEQQQAFMEQETHFEAYHNLFDADQFELFVSMPAEERDLLLTDAYLGRQRKPSPVQVHMAAAFIDWFNGDTPMQKVARRYDVKPRDLRRLRDNMPHYVLESTLDIELPATPKRDIARLAVGNVIYANFPHGRRYEDPDATQAPVIPITSGRRPRK